MTESFVRETETLESTGFGNIKIIQAKDSFRFGIDAVILADFANSISPSAKRIADLGTGNGIIPLILSHKNRNCCISGFDVQSAAIDLAYRNLQLNNLYHRISFTNCDICHIPDNMPELNSSFDVVVTNPPYVARGRGLINDVSGRFIARHETTADLDKFIETAGWLLKENGHMFMVHRPSRLVDLFYSCRKHGLEPKQIRFVAPRQGEQANIVLIDAVAGGGVELKIMNELYVRTDDNRYSSEIMQIYERAD